MALYESSQLLNIVLAANQYYTATHYASNPFAFYRFNQNNLNVYGSLFKLPEIKFNNQANSSKNQAVRRDLGFTSNRALNAVKVAEAELAKGVREINHSNDSVDIRRYKNGAANNLPWCQYFASYCFGAGQGSSNNDTFGFDGSTQNVKCKADNLGYYARKNTGYTPKVGDLAMWTKSATSGHVGIVSAVYADGSFDVIEGNSGKNTDRIVKHHYTSQSSVGSTFDGFVKMSEWTEGTNTNKVYYA